MAEEIRNEKAEKEGVDERTAESRVFKFTKPYTFENKEYTEVDFGALDKMTIKDAVDAQRYVIQRREVAAAMLSETTTAFARAIAFKASGLPVEFFELMPRRSSRPLTAYIQSFFNVSNAVENHVMRLEKPYHFEGKTYTEVDLSPLANVTSLDESAAENAITRAGFVVTETSFNYLYACALAGAATGLGEDFFTGLPLCETVKLKNAVNSQDFFE